MIIFKQAASLSAHLQELQDRGISTGFVPTMGALHQGHVSLVKAAKANGEHVVCSIFVNPTQFNNASDFAKYPVTIARDVDMLEGAGCDILFLPDTAEIYPNGTALSEPYALGYLETILEGKYRPGHFQGVCQVVHRLLDIVHPNHLYLGSKDYQQCMVLRKLTALKSIPTDIIIRPTLREPDGLAMSSRNMRLDPAARQKAPAIYATLQYIQQHLQPGPLTPLIQTATAQLTGAGFKVDYIAIANAQTLEPVHDWDGKSQVVILAAAFLGEVRLIDNLVLSNSGGTEPNSGAAPLTEFD